MICSTTCGNRLRDTFLRNDLHDFDDLLQNLSQQVDVERADIVRKRASSEVHTGNVRKRACPSSSEELLVTVRRKAPPKSPETTLKTTSSMRGRGRACNPSSSEVPAVVDDEAAGLEGWRAFLPTPSGSAIKHTTTGEDKQPTLNNKTRH